MPSRTRRPSSTFHELHDRTHAPAPPVPNDDQFLEAATRPVALRWWHWLPLISVSVLGPFSTDSYVPNLPQMAAELQCSQFQAGLTLQGNWLVAGMAKVGVGHAADRIGRRPVMLAALAVYTVGAVASSLAPTVRLLILARLLQGVGEAAAAVPMAVVRDCIDDAQARMRAMAVVGMLRPLAIVAAPAVGGLLGAAVGWRAVFRYLLAGWGVGSAAAVALLLPETRPPTGTAGGGGRSALRGLCRRVLCARETGGVLLTSSLVLVFPLTMLSNISFVLQQRYGLGTAAAALLIGSVAAMLVAGMGLTAALGGRVAPLGMMRGGMAGCAACALLGVGLATAALVRGAPPPLWQTLAFLYAGIFAASLVLPAAMAIYMQPLKDIAGLAAGVQGFASALLSSGRAAS